MANKDNIIQFPTKHSAKSMDNSVVNLQRMQARIAEIATENTLIQEDMKYLKGCLESNTEELRGIIEECSKVVKTSKVADVFKDFVDVLSSEIDELIKPDEEE